MKHGKRTLGTWVAAGACALLFTAAEANAAPPAPQARLHKSVGLSVTPAKQLVKRATHLDPRVDGYQRLRAGDRAGAIQAFRQALAVSPKDAGLWRLLGDVLMREAEPEQALGCWEEALALNAGDLGLLDRVTRGAVQIGDFERAVDAEAAIVRHLRPYARWGAARVRGLLDGRHLSARDNLRRHLSRYSELATLAGDYSLGEAAARELIKLAPKAVDGRLALAYMHLQAAEFEEAGDLYEEVLAQEPDNTTALNNLGNVHYMARDLDGAARHFEAILDTKNLSPYSQSLALANLAELLQLQGAHKDAELLYSEARDAKPDGAWSYMGLAALYDMTGRYDEAVDAMIDGWERDTSRLTRLNMHFYQPEWYWQRDALIAEIEGDHAIATKLWTRVQNGDVESLHAAAAHHLHSLRLAD